MLTILNGITNIVEYYKNKEYKIIPFPRACLYFSLLFTSLGVAFWAVV